MGRSSDTGPDIRSLALDVLLEVTEEEVFCSRSLGRVLSKYQYLEKNKRAFLTRLVEGTLEYLIRLDYVTGLFSKVPPDRQKPVIRGIFRLSVYQLLFMDSVPDRAVCDEAVKLAKRRGFSGLSGFVNGVLRNIARNKDSIAYPDPEDETTRLSVTYSMPEWIVSDFTARFGIRKAEDMLKAFLAKRPLSITVNRQKTDAEGCKRLLAEEGVDARAIPGNDSSLLISGFDYLEGLSSFRDGLFWVQDISSMEAARACQAKKGDYCIDICAAPGGKSFYLAQCAGKSGTVDSRDISVSKTSLIEEGKDRLGFSNIRVSAADARVLDGSVLGRADVVLADLPCSGLGVLGRKPDLKYRIKKDQIESLSRLQREMLSCAQAYVRPGGRLVYSTCTISSLENEENADWFADSFPFKEASRRQILPDMERDGFFIAVFEKTGT